MPRKRGENRGGTRQGTPGKAYQNRTDLQGPKVIAFRGGQYGERQATTQAQQAAPPGRAPTDTVPVAPPPVEAPAGPGPGELGDLLGATARPDEPLTAGAPFGAGPGPAPGDGPPGDPDLDNLRAIFKAHPSQALLELIVELDGG